MKDYDKDRTAWNASGAMWIRLLELRDLRLEINESDQVMLRILDQRIKNLEDKLHQQQEESMDRDND